jgi:Xaa-Pro aminopeptidase
MLPSVIAFSAVDKLSSISLSMRAEVIIGGMDPAEFEQRRKRVAGGLAEHKVDALLVSSLLNVRYLSGFTGSNGNLLIWQAGAVLFTDPRYDLRAREEVTCHVKVTRRPLVLDVVARIGRLGLRRIGYEQTRMTCDSYEALKSRLPMKASLVPVAGWVEEMRTIKSPAELALIRRSVETNSRAFEQVAGRLKAGITERALAAELEYRMRRLGAEKPAFDTIVAGGVRTALPHSEPSSARLEIGGLVMVDMGALQEGYSSDMTRMLYLGVPTPKVKRTYRAVLEAQMAALDAVRPGILAAQVDRQARRVLKSYGLDRAFVHSTGHGLGLEIHEAPRIGKNSKSRLEVGMTITIEPGAYLEGFGGIRIEDTVSVTSSGCEILTPTSKELRTI